VKLRPRQNDNAAESGVRAPLRPSISVNVPEQLVVTQLEFPLRAVARQTVNSTEWPSSVT